MSYHAKIHKPSPDDIVVGDGGTITVESGGTINFESGSTLSTGDDAIEADLTGASPVVYCHTDSASTAEINAGHTLLAAVAGRTITVVGWSMTAVGGNAGTSTAVTLSDTAGSPVLIATVAVAALTAGAVVQPSSANVTDGAAGIGLGLTAAKGITIEKTGGTLDTCTSVTVTILYTIA